MGRDLEAELRDWDGRYPPAWKPREGETLVATVRQYSTATTTYGQCRTCLVECDDGTRWSIWLSSTMLLGLFQEQRPQLGEKIGLKYCGKHETKGYRRYALVVDRGPAELDFSPLGGERGEVEDGDPFGRIPAASGRR